MQTRRAALLTIATAAAATPLLSEPTPAEQLVYFKPHDYAIVSRLADLIIPRTDTPGALDARVPYRIDHQVSSSPKLQDSFSKGLAMLPADFLSQPETAQVATLQAMIDTPFFATIKDLTVEWYYRSEEGMVKELGFHGNTFRKDFPGCTHPEHWPAETAGTK